MTRTIDAARPTAQGEAAADEAIATLGRAMGRRQHADHGAGRAPAQAAAASPNAGLAGA